MSYSESYPDYRNDCTSLHKYPDITTKCLFLRVEAFFQTQKISFNAPLYASIKDKNYSHLIISN
jgi:hypothetical protein